MKDFTGEELNIGDHVITSSPYWGLAEAIVLKVKEKTVFVKDLGNADIA